MIATGRVAAALLALVLGAGVSALLLGQHHGQVRAVAAVDRVCGDAAASDCGALARSQWSAPLGVPLAAVGLAFYLSLGLLLALALADAAPVHRAAAARAAFLALGAALVADLGLLALQALVIGAFCALCLATYAVNAGALAFLWPARRAPLDALGTRGARPLAAGWALSSLAALAAVAAADAALRARQPPSPGGGLSVPAAASLAEAQARIRALQETLDDAEKLQRYLNDKALREFENAPPQEVDLASAPAQGAPGAPLRVVTYSDFLCPYCRSLAAGLSQLLPRTGGRVGVYFKHFPLEQACNPALVRSVHPGACWLARGAVCAHEQGRFQPYHDRVFSVELNEPGEADVKRLAQQAGLDVARLAECLSSRGVQDRLAADVAEARRIGVRGTPTVLINGRKLASLDTFFEALERESARLGLPPLRLAPTPAR